MLGRTECIWFESETTWEYDISTESASIKGCNKRKNRDFPAGINQWSLTAFKVEQIVESRK